MDLVQNLLIRIKKNCPWTWSLTGGPWTRSMKVVHGSGPKRGPWTPGPCFVLTPHRVPPIEQKFRFEILKIPHSQWNGTLRLHWPEPLCIWLLFLLAGYKRMVLGTTIFSNGKGQVVPNNRNYCGPVKEDHLQRWSWIFQLDCTKMVCSIWFLTQVSWILGT